MTSAKLHDNNHSNWAFGHAIVRKLRANAINMLSFFKFCDIFA